MYDFVEPMSLFTPGMLEKRVQDQATRPSVVLSMDRYVNEQACLPFVAFCLILFLRLTFSKQYFKLCMGSTFLLAALKQSTQEGTF